MGSQVARASLTKSEPLLTSRAAQYSPNIANYGLIQLFLPNTDRLRILLMQSQI
jgi:hypothetical protein